MIKKVFLLFAVAVIILSFGSSGSDDCPDGESRIKMNSFFIVEPGENNSRTMTRYLSSSACCPSRYDCVYRSRCYSIGSIIGENPRYACGPSNNLIEALDYDYGTTQDPFERMSVENINYAYPIQEVPIVNPNIVSCNSKDPQYPQVWKPIEECSTGKMRLKVLDGPSEVVLDGEADIRLNLFKLGGFFTSEYTNFTIEKMEDGTFLIDGLLASYYNVIVFSEGGSMGSLSTIRVDYDENNPSIHTVKTYRDNTCHSCIDYSLGTGLCSRECEGRGVGDICRYSSEEVKEACHLRYPGSEVVLEDGTKIECCDTNLGQKLPDMNVTIDCEMDTIVKKEYALDWKNKPIKMVVVSCG